MDQYFLTGNQPDKVIKVAEDHHADMNAVDPN